MSFEDKYKTWHKYTSYVKSGIRLITCGIALTTGSISILALGLGIAEVVGIAEEWV